MYAVSSYTLEPPETTALAAGVLVGFFIFTKGRTDRQRKLHGRLDDLGGFAIFSDDGRAVAARVVFATKFIAVSTHKYCHRKFFCFEELIGSWPDRRSCRNRSWAFGLADFGGIGG